MRELFRTQNCKRFASMAETGMQIGSLFIPGVVGLAPLAGVTDPAFRCICQELGAGYTVTEMVSSRALVYQDKKSKSLLPRTKAGICGAQIFGNDPKMMAEAAKIAIEISQADFIDINMGCPMPKIAGNGDGCALMNTPALAGDIVAAVKDAVSVPVTAKCRKGWDKGSANAVEFAQLLEERGLDAICIHGRTKAQLYSGKADWAIIKEVKKALSIPVIANGDISDGESAVRCLRETGADYLAVGRAVFGNPWIFREITEAVSGLPKTPRPPLKERVETAMRQFELAREDKGEYIACLEARKHFAWYLRGIPYANYYKEQISAVSDFESLRKIAEGVQRDLRDPKPGERLPFSEYDGI